jgi:hypothetical protein
MTNFRAKCPTIKQTRQGHTNKYAGLPEAVEQIQKLLEDCQLSVTWSIVEQTATWVKVRCTVSHIGNHSETCELGGPPDNGPGRNALQAIKSTWTYLRRVTLFSLLGLVDKDEPDDDGQGGAPATQKAKAPAMPTGSEADKKAFVVVIEQKVGRKLTVPERMDYVLAVAEFAKLATIAECTEWLRDHGAIVDGKVCNKDTKKKAESPGTGNFAVTGPGTPSEREPGDDGIEPPPWNEQS